MQMTEMRQTKPIGTDRGIVENPSPSGGCDYAKQTQLSAFLGWKHRSKPKSKANQSQSGQVDAPLAPFGLTRPIRSIE
jgi:hypothetical protein